MNHFEPLTAWIQPQHLSLDGVRAHRAAFEGHTAHALHITEFLNVRAAAKIGRFLSQEASYKPTYGLFSAKGHVVSADAWQVATEEDRFFHYGMLGETNPRHRLSPNLLTFMRLRQILATPVFKAYINAITGITLGDMTPTKVHQMGYGHFLKPHDDTAGARRLALIFYLSPGWKAEYGGALNIVEQNGKLTTIEAIFNSFALFDVTKHEQHHVTDVQQRAGNHSRLTIGCWFQQ